MTVPNNTPESVADYHVNSDADSAPTSQHHTLGTGATQSSPGDHIHDGRTSKKLYTPISVTGSRGGNAALASLLSALAAQKLIVDNTTI